MLKYLQQNRRFASKKTKTYSIDGIREKYLKSEIAATKS